MLKLLLPRTLMCMAMILATTGCLVGVTWFFTLALYTSGIEELCFAFVVMSGLQGLSILPSEEFELTANTL